MDNSVYCQNDKTLILLDRLIATFILVTYFLVGSVGNLLYILVYLRKQRRRFLFEAKKNNVKNPSIRFKYYANNKAIYTLSISNLILSTVFIPYTILVRVWNLSVFNSLTIKIIEHSKDTFIYMNLLITIILSIERYVAVCKPQYYKTLETNINKIIWLFFLFGFLLATTNYQNHAKSEFSCDLQREKTRLLRFGHFLSTFEGEKEMLNMNLLTSVFLFSLSTILSTFFYIQIGRIEFRRNRNRNRNNLKQPLSKLSPTKERMSLAVTTVTTTQENNTIEDDERPSSHSITSKSNASVQTDFVIDTRVHHHRRKATNFISSETITKISIWLSLIMWMSILPFLLTALRIIPYFKCIYFLFHTENVFSPIVYVYLNKRYRNYLKKSIKKIFKK